MEHYINISKEQNNIENVENLENIEMRREIYPYIEIYGYT